MNFIPLYVLLPLLTAVLISLVGKKIKFICSLLVNLVLLFLTCLTVYLILKGESLIVYKVGGWGIIENIPVGIFLVVDGLTRLLLLIINLIALCAGIYSISYIKNYTGRAKYFALYSLMIAGMNGVVISGDLFNIFVFLEIAAIASYALVAFGIRKEEVEASFKYQILGGISSMMILLGIGMTYWAYGTLNIADIGSLVAQGNELKAVYFIQALFLMGFGLKAALVPFHSWLPDAHSSAPSPISAMLSGVLIKAIGVYVIMRLFFNMFLVSYKLGLIVAVIGTLSMAIGGLLAIGQRDFKRLLAYSSISQIGYVITALGVGILLLAKNESVEIASLAILGGIFHLFNHALFKGLLFLAAGSVEYQTDTRDMEKLGGLSSKMPITTISALSASMGISGVPPFNGFFSKLIIIIALVKAQYYILTVIAVGISIVTLAYFLKFLRRVFFGELKPEWSKIKESPFWMCISMLFLALLCLAASALLIPGIREKFLGPAVDILIQMGDYSKNILEAGL